MKRILLIVIAFFIVVTYAFVFLRNNNQLASSPLARTISESLPNATPMPFAEMTIPYLREREYKSSLSELSQVTETSNYIGYLTNYDSDGLRVNGYLTIPKG